MALLSSLLPQIQSLITSAPDVDVKITGIESDSRRVTPGNVFIALRGTRADGAQYCQEAINRGAAAIVVSDEVTQSFPVPVITVRNARKAYGLLSREFFGRYSEKFPGIAVTGTNGKTSVAYLSAQILAKRFGGSLYCGTLGTAAIKWCSDGIEFAPFGLTSPDSGYFYKELAHASRLGVRSYALEYTSIALDQERLSGVSFDCCVFTNLTRDHLDYHSDLERYYAAKKLLFTDHLVSSSKSKRTAVINAGDPYGARLLKELSGTVDILTFGVKGDTDVFLNKVRGDSYRTEYEICIAGDFIKGECALIGEYNQENLLAVCAASYSCGLTVREIEEFLPLIQPVPGRLEPVAVTGQFELPRVFVDYAHTPDALEKAQKSLRPLTEGKLISVFGCGGDRDRGKRPVMGKVAAEGADITYVTSDNPRTEDPSAILRDIMEGVPPGREVHEVVDRRQAIKEAIFRARPGDVILIAGKGHEPYQEVHGVRHPFSDQAVAREMLMERTAAQVQNG